MILKQLKELSSLSFQSLQKRFIPYLSLTKDTLGKKYNSSKMSLNPVDITDATPSSLHATASLNKVRVRRLENEKSMNISLYFKEKEFNLCRNQLENLEGSLNRLQHNIKKIYDKEMKKKVKKMKKSTDGIKEIEDNDLCVSVPECSIFHGDDKVSLKMLNKDAWIEQAILQIGEQYYAINVNVPSVISLKLPTSFIFVGCPLLPKVDIEFATAEFCTFHWYKFVESCKDDSSLKESGKKGTWHPLAEGDVVIPESDSLGCNIKVVCTPGDGAKKGEPVEVESAIPVSARPDNVPFERRQKYTQNRTQGNVFRVVSYNILADLYADSDFSRDYLFPQCPKDALSFDYRSPLLLKEISGYNADVVCLQEVDLKLFKRSLHPFFNKIGYDGHHCCKAGEVAEGEAIFFRKERYRLLGEHNIHISETFGTDENFKDLLTAVSRSEKMLEKIQGKKTIAQVLVLEDLFNSGKRICVANTHLYFYPRAWHIRLIQTAVILRHIEQLQKQYSSRDQPELSVLLCGDFNSIPLTGVHQLVTSGSLSASALDWYSEGKEEHCGGIDLSHQLDLASACPDLPYTNYVTTFIATLDYIFYSKGSMQVDRVIPMPSHEEVTRFTCLPNKVFPSDHLPVICELKWLEEGVDQME